MQRKQAEAISVSGSAYTPRSRKMAQLNPGKHFITVYATGSTAAEIITGMMSFCRMDVRVDRPRVKSTVICIIRDALEDRRQGEIRQVTSFSAAVA